MSWVGILSFWGIHLRTAILPIGLILVIAHSLIMGLPPLPLEPSQHLIVDKMKNEMFLYEGGRLVERFTVATGREPDMTPEGRFQIVLKSLVPNEPEQRHLFGTRWMGLGAPGGEDGNVYGIHGTGQPWSLGGHESAGCIRMATADAERLYDMVREGDTVVYIMPHRYSILLHRSTNPAS